MPNYWGGGYYISDDFWNRARSDPPQGKERLMKLAKFIAELACESSDIAHGLLENGRIESTDSQILIVANRLRKGRSDQTTCLRAKGLTEKDWTVLNRLVEAAPKSGAGQAAR